MNETNEMKKQVYIPYMCDHVYILGAALETQNIPVEILPPPDDETMAIGLDLCKGKECSPCFTSTGDIIRRARQPGFDPARAAVLMPGATGSCRFGQYNILQRNILEEQGLGAIEILSPSAENSYRGFGDNPTKLRQLVWQGIVAVDLLTRLLHEYRPYERNPGQTDMVYQQCLGHLVAAMRAGAGKKLVEAMHWVAGRFEQLPVDRRHRRPLIGVIGEIYVRLNPYSNQQIIRQIEAAGGEAMLTSMMEWLYYTNWVVKTTSRSLGQYFDFVEVFLVDKYQSYQEHKLMKPVAHLLTTPHESPIPQLMAHLEPYYSPLLDTEAVMSIGRAIDYAKQGVSGIINVMPFSCMPGIITAGLAGRIRADLDNVPWLDLSYDAQASTNINTRLEAFMYQATQFHRRTAGDAS
jgi:predicted nucleotide-binding protein (sugar kinase/HSP70/actin superfamily)